MDSFSDFEIRVLRWVHAHPVPEDQLRMKAPKRYSKTILMLIYRKVICPGPDGTTLSQPALDAIAQYRELFWVNIWHNFWLGFITGLLTGVLVTLLCAWLL